MEPDADQLLIANKALTVIFILLICLTNGVLITLQIRKLRFYQSVKLMTIISLAIGDIIFAMFPLLVNARALYEPDFSYRTCRLLTSVVTYQNFLIHFVYGLGLVVLAAEVFLRDRFHTQWNKTFSAVAISSVPWILGLIIILPLCMANVDYRNGCTNSQSLDTLFGVSVILPVSLSILVNFVLYCVKCPISQRHVINTSQQPIIVSQQNIKAEANSSTQYPLQCCDSGDGFFSLRTPIPFPQNATSHPPSYPRSANQQFMFQTSKDNVNLNQEVNTEPVTSLNHRTEAKKLLIIAVIFGLMVLPYASFHFRADRSFWPNSVTLTVFTQLVFWLMVARSCLTPIIMIWFSKHT